MQTPYQFFRRHAGYSYDPATETPAQGRARCARSLADAEEWARDAGLSFAWEIDDVDSSEWSYDPDPWAQWCCIARDASGAAVASLGCIDFGRGRDPWSDSYRRVVEAELASEVYHG